MRRLAETTDRAGDGRTLTVRLVPWATPARVSDDGGRTFYDEAFARGGLSVGDGTRILAADEHGGAVVGRLVDVDNRADGLYGNVRVADTVAGRDLLALYDEGILEAVSIEFDDPTPTPAAGAAVVRRAATLTGLAFTLHPQHDAPILARRSSSTTEGIPAVTMTDLPPDAPPDDPPDTPDRPDDPTEPEPVRTRSAPVPRPHLAPTPTPPVAAAHWRSLVDYDDATYAQAQHRSGDTTRPAPGSYQRALADQITTNNPGVIPPGWIRDIKGLVSAGRPTIDAIGTSPLPSSGMDVSWPYFAGDLMTLVGEQLTQKSQVTSVRVDVLKGNKPLRTFAGGSDISYQLIRRSDPSYREAYVRIMYMAYAAVTNNAAADDLTTSATGHVEYDPVAPDANGNALRAALFSASAIVQQKTGSPASVVLAAPDQFVRIGSLGGLYPTVYGTQNVSGTAQASTLEVNVSGLRVVGDAALAAGTILVTNRAAASWLEDGPFTVTAEDVALLGQNVAVWGMGALAVFVPAAVVKLSDTTP